jgi:hypothetical protein
MPTGAGGGGGGNTNHGNLLQRTLVLLDEVFDALAALQAGPYPGNPLVTGSNVLNPSDPTSASHVLLQMAFVLHLLEQRTNVGGKMSAAWAGPQGANDATDRLMQFTARLLRELQQKPYAGGGAQFQPNIPWDQTGAGDVKRTRHLVALAYTLYGELLQKPPAPQGAPPIPTDPCLNNASAIPSVIQADIALLQVNHYLHLLGQAIPTKTM